MTADKGTEGTASALRAPGESCKADLPAPVLALPCPFCGGAARTLNNGWTGCPNWECRPFKSPAAWNRRSDPVREALKEAATILEKTADLVGSPGLALSLLGDAKRARAALSKAEAHAKKEE